MKIPEWLLKHTFAVQYNPNCPSPFLVRMAGTYGDIDHKSYGGLFSKSETNDALGFGKSIEEAGKKALEVQEKNRIEHRKKLMSK